MTSAPVVLATRNAGKVRELAPLFASFGVRVETLEDAGVPAHAEEELLEDAPTFSGNAHKKARYFAARLPGRLVLAEDSGLCVAALGGAPGVHSKRWGLAVSGPSGEAPLAGAALDAHNRAQLLRALAGAADRRAWFACSAVLLRLTADGEEMAEGEGRTEGRILEEPCGTAGFGYDALFWSTELEACFGAVAREEKARVSHRSRAVQGAWAAFQARGGTIFR